MFTMSTTESAPNIVQQLLIDRPSFHLGGSAHWVSLPETLHALRASTKPGDVTLETGVGASTVVFAAAGASHTAISPDPQEHDLVREYCKRIGIDDSPLTFVAGFSEDVLPSLLSRERTLDVAFIDGAHSFPLPRGRLVLHRAFAKARRQARPRRHHDSVGGAGIPSYVA